jgi:topoisomerase-4 subunit A
LAAGGRGVTLLDLADGQTLLQALALSSAGLVLQGIGRGGKRQEETLAGAALAAYVGKRARKGRVANVKFKADGMRPVLPPVAA